MLRYSELSGHITSVVKKSYSDRILINDSGFPIPRRKHKKRERNETDILVNNERKIKWGKIMGNSFGYLPQKN